MTGKKAKLKASQEISRVQYQNYQALDEHVSPSVLRRGTKNNRQVMPEVLGCVDLNLPKLPSNIIVGQKSKVLYLKQKSIKFRDKENTIGSGLVPR